MYNTISRGGLALSRVKLSRLVYLRSDIQNIVIRVLSTLHFARLESHASKLKTNRQRRRVRVRISMRIYAYPNTDARDLFAGNVSHTLTIRYRRINSINQPSAFDLLSFRVRIILGRTNDYE